jgi:hypothetical protein
LRLRLGRHFTRRALILEPLEQLKNVIRGIVGPDYDEALVERTAHALHELAPYVYRLLSQSDFGNINCYFQDGWLRSVAPAPSHLVPKVYRPKRGD